MKIKTAQIHQDLCVMMPFCHKVEILTKIRPKIRLFLKEKSNIRPWSAKVDHSGNTGFNSLSYNNCCDVLLGNLSSLPSNQSQAFKLTQFHSLFKRPREEVLEDYYVQYNQEEEYTPENVYSQGRLLKLIFVFGRFYIC